MDVATLAALEELRRLKARYCQYVDQKRWSELGGLFAPDAVMGSERGGAVHTTQGRDAIVARIREVLADRPTIHHASNPDIRLTSPTGAEGIWTVSYTSQGGPTGHGHYLESYVRREGRWFYARMILRVDFVVEKSGA
jgi:hypothetical protein